MSRHEGGNFEEAPVGTGPMSADPKILAETALGSFNGDAMLFKDLSAHPEIIEKISALDGAEIDVEDMERRSKMYSKINSTFHAKLGHAGAPGSKLEGDDFLEAESFLDLEIARLNNLRNALLAISLGQHTS